MKQDYKQALMEACLAVTPIQGNYSGRTETVDTGVSNDEDVMKAALDPKTAKAKTDIAKRVCEMLVQAKGAPLTEKEVRDVVMSIA